MIPGPVISAFSQALEAAERYVGATAPNPAVGCAVLDAAGEVLAVEAHQRAGAEHAEALAIRRCREQGLADRIHTIVATLEPCNHTGRRPPCSEAILGTSAREVWVGVEDPNPRVRGGGVAWLREQGLQVRQLSGETDAESESLHRACSRLIAPFSKWSRTGTPWVVLKQALDAKGSMIPPAGRKTFTEPASLVLAHQLRRRADAILTSASTIIADDPEFTVRHVPDHPGKSRWLVILDRRRRTPDRYRAAAEARGFHVRLEENLADALALLGAHDVLEVLVEAGPTLSQAVLSEGLWDEHVLIRRTGQPGEPDQVQILRRDLR